jgi:hypothetical protein
MPRSRPPRRRASDKDVEQARIDAIRTAARQKFQRRTLHLFLLSSAGLPLALLAMRSVTRHSHISFCTSRHLASAVAAAFLLLSAYLFVALASLAIDARRAQLGNVWEDAVALAAVLVLGICTHAWLGTNMLKTWCLA